MDNNVNKNNTIINRNGINKIDKAVKRCRFDDFQQLIRIANPDADSRLYRYSLEQQMIVSAYTRIFNLKQLLYILSTYKTGTGNAEYIEKCIKNICERKMTEFIKACRDESFLNRMDVYELLKNEMRTGFAGCTGQSALHDMHRIALAAFRIEKDFKFREWELKRQILSDNLLMHKALKKFDAERKKSMRIWDKFEEGYAAYIENLQGGNDIICDEDYLYFCMKKKPVRVVTYTDKVLKHTISFLSFIEQNPELTASKMFKKLFEPYSLKMDLYHADMDLVAGHIHYFRLINISKIMLMVEKFGMEYMYLGYDMAYILQKPLTEAEKDVPELLSMELDEAEGLIINDIERLMGDGYGVDDIASLQILYCIYLELETMWLTFEMNRIMRYPRGASAFLVLKEKKKSLNLVTGYFGYYKDKAGYDGFLHKQSGKIVELPAWRG